MVMEASDASAAHAQGHVITCGYLLKMKQRPIKVSAHALFVCCSTATLTTDDDYGGVGWLCCVTVLDIVFVCMCLCRHCGGSSYLRVSDAGSRWSCMR